MRAILAIFILSFILVGATLAQAYEENTDRPGNDFYQFTPTPSDPFICALHCDSTTTCDAWTYLKPDEFYPEGQCFLKAPAPNPGPSDCCVSGLSATN